MNEAQLNIVQHPFLVENINLIEDGISRVPAEVKQISTAADDDCTQKLKAVQEARRVASESQHRRLNLTGNLPLFFLSGLEKQ